MLSATHDAGAGALGSRAKHEKPTKQDQAEAGSRATSEGGANERRASLRSSQSTRPTQKCPKHTTNLDALPWLVHCCREVTGCELPRHKGLRAADVRPQLSKCPFATGPETTVDRGQPMFTRLAPSNGIRRIHHHNEREDGTRRVSTWLQGGTKPRRADLQSDLARVHR